MEKRHDYQDYPAGSCVKWQGPPTLALVPDGSLSDRAATWPHCIIVRQGPVSISIEEIFSWEICSSQGRLPMPGVHDVGDCAELN